MEISHPNQPELTPAERQELEYLRGVIERAIADGVFTKGERDRVSALLSSQHNVLVEELTLIREMVRDKAASGELTLDYS